MRTVLFLSAITLFVGLGLWQFGRSHAEVPFAGYEPARSAGSMTPLVGAAELRRREVGDHVAVAGRVSGSTRPGYSGFVMFHQSVTKVGKEGAPGPSDDAIGRELSAHSERPPFSLDADGVTVRITNWNYLASGVANASILDEFRTTDDPVAMEVRVRTRGARVGDPVVVLGRLEPAAEDGTIHLRATGVVHGDAATFLASRNVPLPRSPNVPTATNVLARRAAPLGASLAAIGVVLLVACGLRGVVRLRAPRAA